MSGVTLSTAHRRRLRQLWRSAGWPCRDAVEIELLAAGMLVRRWDGEGRETLQVSDAGVRMLAETLEANRAARSAHEALVERVAARMIDAGRVVWRGLSLRASLGDEAGRARWVVAMPDVFSIRHTTVASYVEPIVHEIKVRRADLLADLRRPDKGAAYLALAGQCWYVIAAGIAEPEEIPAAFGVIAAGEAGLDVLRPAPARPMELPFATWMALARADAWRGTELVDQPWLADAQGPAHAEGGGPDTGHAPGGA